MGKGIAGEFTGFTIKNVHSSDLGITRVSDGNRYSEDLLPTIKDVAVDIPGNDGMYYFGSYYSSKSFPLSIAFDSVEEDQIRRMKVLFGTKDLVPLIFDEKPYKCYMVKASQIPVLKYICFEENGKKIYKGEGALNFIAYYPYARGLGKYKSDFNSSIQGLLPSNMPATKGTREGLDSTSTTLCNYGDMPADFSIWVTPPENGKLEFSNGNIATLKMEDVELETSDTYIKYNSKSELLEGCDSNFKPTSTLYNKYIVSGNFFKLTNEENTINSTGTIKKIDYNYLFY